MPDTEKAKQVLEERLAQLAAKVDNIEGDLREHEEKDFEERATEIAGDEVLEGLEQAGLLEIAQINAALKRIEEGSYGECVLCGADIGAKRLELIPHASHCVSCEEQVQSAR